MRYDGPIWLALARTLTLTAALSCSGTSKTDDDTGTSPADADADTDADSDSDADADSDSDTDPFDVPDPVGDPATVELGGECPLETKYGSFAVQVLDIYSTVSGAIADGVVPITVLEEVGTGDSCKLLRRNNAFC